MDCQKCFAMPDTSQTLAALRAIQARVSALIDSLSADSENHESISRYLSGEKLERYNAGICLECGDLPAESRGLCNADYQAFNRKVNKGKLVDIEQVELGNILPPDKPGAKAKHRFGATATEAYAKGTSRRKKSP
jgi:hypothetical protein